MVVGFLDLRGSHRSPRSAALPEPFDYYCWDLYARSATATQGDPERKALRRETLHEHRGGRRRARRRSAAHVAARDRRTATSRPWRGSASATTCWPTRATSCACTSWSSAFELLKASGRHPPGDRGQERGCWVMPLGAGGGVAASRTDKIIVRSNGTVTYTGKDIAYQLWKLGLLDRDFRYRSGTEDGGLGPPPSERRERAPALRPRRAGLQRHRRRPELPAARGAPGSGRSATPRRRSARSTSPTRRSCSRRATARASATSRGRAATSRSMSGRKGLGVKADDLMDALVAKAPRGDRRRATASAARDERDALPPEIAVGALRYFLLKFAARASSPSTWRRRSPSRARPAPTSRTRWCARATSAASCSGAGPRRSLRRRDRRPAARRGATTSGTCPRGRRRSGRR